MKAFAVVVTYHPDLDRLITLVGSLLKQRIQVIVVDNSSEFNFDNAIFKSTQILKNSNKNGIAGAQNIGVSHATMAGAEFVCFFDQDSEVPDNFGCCLIENRDPSVLSVYSPSIFDEKTGTELPSFRISQFGLPNKVYSKGSTKEYRVDLVISSGTVVTSKTFELVGLLNSDLFIDLVDFEWCFRCMELKVPITCVPEVKMKHSIGLGRSFMTGSVHNSFRHYYKQRNPFYLLAYRHVPVMYSLKMILIASIHSCIMIVTQREFKLYCKSTVRAMYDGIKYCLK